MLLQIHWIQMCFVGKYSNQIPVVGTVHVVSCCNITSLVNPVGCGWTSQRLGNHWQPIVSHRALASLQHQRKLCLATIATVSCVLAHRTKALIETWIFFHMLISCLVGVSKWHMHTVVSPLVPLTKLLSTLLLYCLAVRDWKAPCRMCRG